ncbi:hypothetical protein FD20_GL000305 [Liquorilactobacillus uvarum DSM 19971]|uniref:Uncharacterized protein n=1 Tax=Liquorilactobacillus uvarum DSM 19971 TaxID=1423812 RepID=A0A0R1PZF3_9LACO|nr:hypothetical protein FD20_GL000305 [Liquorilactobacillus uvarum DSM 19971]
MALSETWLWPCKISIESEVTKVLLTSPNNIETERTAQMTSVNAEQNKTMFIRTIKQRIIFL